MGGSAPKINIPKDLKEIYYFKNFSTYTDDSELKHKVKLGNEMYEQVKFIKDKLKMIRNEYKNKEKILGNDGDFLYDLIRFHHNFREKIKDFDYFTLDYVKEYKYLRCFYIVRTNGEKIDFSIDKCLNSLIKKQNQRSLEIPDFYDI